MPEVANLQVTIGVDTSQLDAGMARANQSVSGLGTALSGLATGAAIAGITAIGAGFAGAITTAAGFEKQISAISAVAGPGAASIDQLRAVALQLGKDTSFSASEAAAGMEEMVKAGLSIADVMGGGARAALDLAAAGSLSVAEAATIASNAMNAFGLSGSDMAHIADTLAGASVASATDVHQLGFALAAVGAVAHTIGLSLDDTTTAISLMASAGLKGSDAGTSLKTMLLNLSPSTKAATSEMRDLGIITMDNNKIMEQAARWGIDTGGSIDDVTQRLFASITGWKEGTKVTAEQTKTWNDASKSLGLMTNQFFNADGSVKSFRDISEILKTSLAGLTKEQQINALKTMFGTDAIRAAAIAAEMGAKGYDEMTAAEAAAGGAQAIATERLNNFMGSLEKFKGSVETAAIMIGSLFLPALKEFADAVTDDVNSAIEIIEQLPDAWRTVGQVFANDWSPSETLTPFINFVGTAAIKVKELVDVVIGLPEPIKAAGIAFAAVMLAAGPLTTALQALPVIFRLLAAPIAAVLSPLGLLAAGIAGLAAAWTANVGDIQGKTRQLLDVLGPAFTSLGPIVQKALGGDVAGAFTDFKTLLGTVGAQLAPIIAGWAKEFADWAPQAIAALLGGAGDLVGRLTTWIGEQVAKIDWVQIWARGTTVVNNMSVWFVSLATQFAIWIGAQVALIPWATVWAQAKDVLISAAIWFAGAATQFATWIGAQVALIPWADVWNKAVTVFDSAVMWFGDAAVKLATWIGDQVALIDWPTVWGKAVGVVEGLITALATIASEAATLLGTWLSEQVAKITWPDVWATVTGLFEAMQTKFTEEAAKINWVTVMSGNPEAATQMAEWLNTTIAAIDWATVGTNFGTFLATAIAQLPVMVGNALIAMIVAAFKLTFAAEAVLTGFINSFITFIGALDIAAISQAFFVFLTSVLAATFPKVFGDQATVAGFAAGLVTMVSAVSPITFVAAMVNLFLTSLQTAWSQAVSRFTPTLPSFGGASSTPGSAMPGGDPQSSTSGSGTFTPLRNIGPSEPGAARMSNASVPQVNQFGSFSSGLSAAEAKAACGPAALSWFMNKYGRAPTSREAVNLAQSYGWDAGKGMYGPGAFSNALAAAGIPNTLNSNPSEAQIAQLAASGEPFALSTTGHYYQVQGGNLGGLNVGGSGTAGGGSPVMSLQQIQALSGSVNGTIVPNAPPAPPDTSAAPPSNWGSGAPMEKLQTAWAPGGFLDVTAWGERTRPIMALMGQMSTKVVDQTVQMAQGSSVAITDMGTGFSVVSKDMAGNTISTFTDLNGNVTNQLVTMADGSKVSLEAMSAAGQASVQSMGDRIVTTMTDMSGNVTTTTTDLSGRVIDQATVMAAGTTAAWSGMTATLDASTTQMAQGILVNAVQFSEGFSTITRDMAGNAISTFTDFTGQVVGQTVTMANGTQVSLETMSTLGQVTVQNMGTVIVTTMTDMAGNVTTTTTDLAGHVIDQATVMAVGVGAATTAQWTDVTTQTTAGATGVVAQVTDMAVRSLEVVTQLENGYTLTIREMGETTTAIVTDMSGNIVHIFEDMGANATTSVTAMATAVVEQTQTMADDASSSVTDMASEIGDQMTIVAKSFKDVVSPIEDFQGALDSIEPPDLGDVVDELDKVTKAAQKAAAAIKKVGGSDSDDGKGHGGHIGGGGGDSAGDVGPSSFGSEMVAPSSATKGDIVINIALNGANLSSSREMQDAVIVALESASARGRY